MKYNLSKIMLKAWKVYRSSKQISFGEALHRAWLSAKAEEINAKRIETAKQVAGITEEINTFAKWKELGYKVVHGTPTDLISSFFFSDIPLPFPT